MSTLKLHLSDLRKWVSGLGHPDFYLPIVKNSNDPLFFQQFYLKNTGQGNGVSGIDMNIGDQYTIQSRNNLKMILNWI